MRLMMYCSRSLIEPDGLALVDILGASVRNNFRNNVTGALYFDGRAFLQAIEGPADRIGPLFERISADPRHDDIVMLHDSVAETRRFGAWAMKLTLNDAGPGDVGDLGDVTPAALRTANAARVDALMRALIRARGSNTDRRA